MDDAARGAAVAALEFDWSVERRDSAAEEYRRFLRLVGENPGDQLVPSRDVDLVWHAHRDLGDAAAQAAPTHRDHSAPNRALLFSRTLDLYANAFGKPGPAWSTPAECRAENPEPPQPGE